MRLFALAVAVPLASLALQLGAPNEALAQKAKPTSDTTKKPPATETKNDWSELEGKKDEDEPPPPAKPAAQTESQAVDLAKEWDIYDVDEKDGKYYFFIGLRYRGNIIPAFMLNLFLDEGKTIYTNQIGVEFDLRKDGFSLIPALSYHEIGTGDILFHQKNTSTSVIGNYSVVNSGMKLVYASVDLLWSAQISKNVAFEYGAGFGLGAVFGDLENSWVRADPNGNLQAEDGRRFSRCNAVDVRGTGCNKEDHQNSDVDKVNGYKEPSWFDGGSKPALFPWISVPQIGLRVKPMKNFVGRVGLGFALTGFWFGINGEYGLEQKPKP